jgi:hypothetical protein
MAKTVIRKKTEILVDMPLLSRIEKSVAAADIKIYTVLPTRGGSNENGKWFDDRVTGGAGTKVLLTAISSAEKSDALIEALEPLLDTYGIIVTRSDVEIIRGEKF